MLTLSEEYLRQVEARLASANKPDGSTVFEAEVIRKDAPALLLEVRRLQEELRRKIELENKRNES